jgi:hypothetical protein
VMLIGVIDHDLASHCSPVTHAARASSRPPTAEVFLRAGTGYVRLYGGASITDVDMVAS